MLSDAQLVAYRRDGFVVIENVLMEAELRNARSVLAELVENARGLTGPTDVYDLEPDHTPEAPLLRRIKFPHRHNDFFGKLGRSPRMVAILRQLLGPSFRIFGSKINFKLPHIGSPVGWHQDWAFYPHTNEDFAIAGVMLDDCGLENSPLLFIPGSHRGEIHDHHMNGLFLGAIDPQNANIDFKTAVPALGKAGSVSFHHVRTVHGSARNKSELSRALLLYEYAAADAWPLDGIRDWDAYVASFVEGKATVSPRMVELPVRLPWPQEVSSIRTIYEVQSAAKSHYFENMHPTKKA